MCIAIVNSTTPKLLDKWPPVLETFSTKKKRISFANDTNSFFDNVFKNEGSLISNKFMFNLDKARMNIPDYLNI